MHSLPSIRRIARELGVKHKLADRYYWTSVVDNQNLDVRFAGLPRTFGASFTYR